MFYYQLEGPKPKLSDFDPKIHNLNYRKKIVEIICYCLMPNHFHFLLKQVRDRSITEFVSKLSNSYTKYFNTKNERVGPLLQGEFKVVHIESDEQLVHLSRYIHLNPLVDYVTKDLKTYPWSSYLEYVGFSSNHVLDKEPVLGQFSSTENYQQFVIDQEDYAKNLELLKHQALDLPDFPRVRA